MIRRGMKLAGTTAALVMLSATGASAHECCIVQTAVTSHGFDTTGILVNTNALMGAGRQETDGHAIDYLPDWFSQGIGAAFGTCFPG